MANHARAGLAATAADLIDITRLLAAYATDAPDPAIREQRVVFGTSGHRGSAFKRSFNTAHIAAISQAVSDYRGEQGIDGPLYLGRDTHVLSAPAWHDVLEVLAGNGVEVSITLSRAKRPGLRR